MKHQHHFQLNVFIRSLYIYLVPDEFDMKIYYALIFFTFKLNSTLKEKPSPSS